MNFDLFEELVAHSVERRSAIRQEKGAEYTQTGEAYKNEESDVLANFKSVSSRFGVSPLTALGVYMGKHFDSIERFTNDITHVTDYNEAVSKVMAGEGILSRLDDARNYLDLFEALLFEFNLHPLQVSVVTEGPAEVGEDVDDITEYEESLEDRAAELMDEQLSLEPEAEEASSLKLVEDTGTASSPDELIKALDALNVTE